MGPARGASSPASTGAQRVSLKDIADELGISQTAVSFAINDRPGVSEQTRRRVKQVAAELGWTPVYAAQALGSSRTMTIGFAPARSVQGLTDETFMLHFMAGVHTSLSPKGYGLLYRPCRSLNEEMSVYRGWASSKRVDGVILVDLRADDPRPALLRELGVRAVLAGGPDPNDYVPSLSIDDSRTMGTVLEHLSSLGHRRIAYLSGDANLDYSQGRVAAFRSFAKRRRLESIAIEFTNFAPERAVTLTMGMLRSPQPPTAFIYETEILAAASLHAMAKAYAPFVRKIEVETETLDMVREAVEAGADIIMLDNMSHDMMKEAVALIDGRAETECSGNVTKENIAALADIGVDYISSGALTHSAPILDLSLKHLHRI